MIDIKGKLKESKRFWSNLPDDICAKGNLTESNEEQCWNSHTKGRWGLLLLTVTISVCLPGIKITPLCSQINTFSPSTIVTSYMENFYTSSETLLPRGLWSFLHLLSLLQHAEYCWSEWWIGQQVVLSGRGNIWPPHFGPLQIITKWCNKRYFHSLVGASNHFKHRSKSGR